MKKQVRVHHTNHVKSMLPIIVSMLRLVCGLTLLFCLSTLGSMCSSYDVQELHYSHLKDESEGYMSPLARQGGKSLVHPDAENPLPGALTAWLHVEGTSVDYPVAALEPTMADTFYLNHTLWGEASYLGCPYLDRRSASDSAHLLVYGHHFIGSTSMFGTLWNRYQPSAFSGTGTAQWSPYASGIKQTAIRFQPFCALRVPRSYAPIQRFTFTSADDLKSWLTSIAEEASACCPNWKDRIEQATRVLTLATCTEGNGKSSMRTLVLFTTQA